MRHEIKIRFDGNDIPGGAETVLKRAGCGPDVAMIEDVPVLRQVVVWVTLDNRDPRVLELLGQLGDYGATWLTIHNDRFTEAELGGARLLVMQSNGECEIDGGVEWGTIYDLAKGCPACGTGAEQTSALLLNGEQVSRLESQHAAATYHWHHLVDEGLAAELLRVGATGLSFRSVYGVTREKRQHRLRWKQMCAERVLPPMSPNSSGFVRERACGVCHRNGYFTNTHHEPARFVYRELDLQGSLDVNRTWENVGYAILEPEMRESLLSKPWMVVSPKVRQVLVQGGVTCFDWTPIRVDAAD